MILSIDIGGTAVKFGILDPIGTFQERGEVPTEAAKGAKALKEKIGTLIQHVRETHDIKGVAIATAGIIDEEAGRVVYALPSTWPGYSGTNWKNFIETNFHLPVVVENDTNAAALGELTFGAAKDTEDFFMLTIGTSIGGALVLNKKIVHGAAKCAGEIALMYVPEGTLHECASASALLRSTENEKHLAKNSLDGRAFFSLLEKGNPLAENAVKKYADALAGGISNIASVLNPPLFVLGGGIMAKGAHIRPYLLQSLKKRMLPIVFNHTHIAFAVCGNDAGLLGAASLMFRQFGQTKC